MNIQVNKADKITATAMVDSLELAIDMMQNVYDDAAANDPQAASTGLRTAIQDLQMLRVAYMLVARSASI